MRATFDVPYQQDRVGTLNTIARKLALRPATKSCRLEQETVPYVSVRLRLR